MRCRTAISIHNDLAPGQARVAVRAADDKGPRRVHPPFGVGGDPAFGQNLGDIGFDDVADVGTGLACIGVLRRQDDRGHANRLAVFIAHGKLAFGVGAQRWLCPVFAHFGQTAQDRMGIVDRRRHQLWRLVGGETEHDALIARAFFLVA